MKALPIAVVGLNFGRHVLDDLARDSGKKLFRLAAVCDADPARAGEMGRRWKVPAFTDLGELLRVREIPTIGLFTGPAGRAALLRTVLRAGKDVMTTKPFESDPDEAAAVLREAARRRRIVHLNSPAPRLSPDLEQIERWRAKFSLGKVVGARGETWARYREKRDGSWYDDPVRCPAAPVFRLGIYLINDLVSLCGAASEVQVLQSRVATGRPTPDNAQLGIRFRSGALANVYASFCVGDAQPYRNSLTLNFERGTVCRNVGPRGAEGVELELAVAGKGGRLRIERKVVAAGSGSYAWREFHRAVTRRDLPPPAFARRVVMGIKIVDAMRRAAVSGGAAAVA